MVELYTRTKRRPNYERWIRGMEKKVFLELKRILEINLDLPTEFYTFQETGNGREWFRSGCFNYSAYHRENEIIKITETKIGVNVFYDMTLKEFIENMGHEMVHYFDLVNNRKFQLYHGREFDKIMDEWNKKLDDYGINIKNWKREGNRI